MDEQNFPNDFQDDQVTGNVQEEPVQEEPAQTNYYQDNTQTPYQQSYANTYSEPQQPKNQTNILAIVGLVLGILSIVLSCCYGIGILFGIAGIICSALSKKKGKSGVGTAGLICSIVGTVFSVLMIIYFIAIFAYAFSDPDLQNIINSYS